MTRYSALYTRLMVWVTVPAGVVLTTVRLISLPLASKVPLVPQLASVPS